MSDRFPFVTGGLALLFVGAGAMGYRALVDAGSPEDPIESVGALFDWVRGIEDAMGDGESPRPVARDLRGRAQESPATPAREEPPIAASAAAADTGRRLDLEHPSPADIAFLGRVLESDDPPARLSATRALVIAGPAEGISMLLAAAARHEQDADLYCLGALEIARLERASTALRAFLLALEASPPLPPGCRSEVSDRFSLIIKGGPAPVLDLAADTEELVRAYAARALADAEGEPVDDVLLGLLSDPSLEVRRRAWAAWEDRPRTPTQAARLAAAAAAEEDASLGARAMSIAEAE